VATFDDACPTSSSFRTNNMFGETIQELVA
jgi:hypothetical protein